MENQNPGSMSDEDLDNVIAAATGVQPTPAAPAKDEPTGAAPTGEEPTPAQPEQPVAPEAPAEGAPAVTPEEGQPQPSRREQLRVTQLLAKMREDQQTVTPASPTVPSAPKAPEGSIDYDKDLEGADPETIRRIKEDRERTSQFAYQQGLEQTKSIRFHTRLEIDAPQIETKYPQLDKTSDKFKPQLANAINQMYLSAVGYDPKSDKVQNPDIRYKDYVESIFELGHEIGTEEARAATVEVKKQAAQTGLRPGAQQAKTLNLNKIPSQMSDEELDAIIAQAVPPQKR